MLLTYTWQLYEASLAAETIRYVLLHLQLLRVTVDYLHLVLVCKHY